jgi:hypothetical protein
VMHNTFLAQVSCRTVWLPCYLRMMHRQLAAVQL